MESNLPPARGVGFATTPITDEQLRALRDRFGPNETPDQPALLARELLALRAMMLARTTSQFDGYQLEAHKTAGSMPPRDRVFMASMGLAGEAGEVVDELKKVHFHAKPYDREKLLRELGDVLWYLAELATAHELSLQDIAHANLEKLRKRHGGETFKPHAEQDRSPERKPFDASGGLRD